MIERLSSPNLSADPLKVSREGDMNAVDFCDPATDRFLFVKLYKTLPEISVVYGVCKMNVKHSGMVSCN